MHDEKKELSLNFKWIIFSGLQNAQFTETIKQAQHLDELEVPIGKSAEWENQNQMKLKPKLKPRMNEPLALELWRNNKKGNRPPSKYCLNQFLIFMNQKNDIFSVSFISCIARVD